MPNSTGRGNAGRVLRILLIGPTPPPLGGASLRVQELLEGLRNREDVAIRHIETHLPGLPSLVLRRLVKGLEVLGRSAIWMRWADVVTVHLNERGRFLIGPVIWILTRLLRRPMVLRVFGGAFSDQMLRLPRWWRWLCRRTICRSEVILVQTRHLHSALRNSCVGELRILPNYVARGTSRDPGGSVERKESTACSRFVYLGRVARSKGVEEILEVARAGGFEFTVDIWGPLEDGYTKAELEERGAGRVSYRGISEAGKVLALLKRYDCLLLPSYHEGEGHPAVILEAYCAGIPVIATKWKAIPEIVDESVGLLVEPRNWQALHGAMRRLNVEPAAWGRMREMAALRCEEYGFEQHISAFLAGCERARVLGPGTRS